MTFVFTCIYFISPQGINGNQMSRKDKEINGTPEVYVTIPVPLSENGHKNLIRIQGRRQDRTGIKTTLKEIAKEIIEKAKE